MKRVLFAAAVALSACGAASASSYSGAAIRGTVIDAETRAPVSGVVVVSEWFLEGGFFHTDTVGRLLVQEVVTDEQGNYFLPAWGPLEAKEGRFQRGSPRLSFYKVGYVFKSVDNQEDAAPYIKLPNPLISEWNGKTISIEPFRDSPGRGTYFSELAGASLLFRLNREKCGWELMPRMTKELLQRRAVYKAHHAPEHLPSAEELARKGECRHPDTDSSQP